MERNDKRLGALGKKLMKSLEEKAEKKSIKMKDGDIIAYDPPTRLSSQPQAARRGEAQRRQNRQRL